VLGAVIFLVSWMSNDGPRVVDRESGQLELPVMRHEKDAIVDDVQRVQQAKPKPVERGELRIERLERVDMLPGMFVAEDKEKLANRGEPGCISRPRGYCN
jgi:hypothetical protein